MALYHVHCCRGICENHVWYEHTSTSQERAVAKSRFQWAGLVFGFLLSLELRLRARFGKQHCMLLNSLSFFRFVSILPELVLRLRFSISAPLLVAPFSVFFVVASSSPSWFSWRSSESFCFWWFGEDSGGELGLKPRGEDLDAWDRRGVAKWWFGVLPREGVKSKNEIEGTRMRYFESACWSLKHVCQIRAYFWSPRVLIRLWSILLLLLE